LIKTIKIKNNIKIYNFVEYNFVSRGKCVDKLWK